MAIRLTQTLTITPDQLDLPDLIVRVAELGLVRDRIVQDRHEVPEELAQALRDADRELAIRLRDDKERRLKILKTRREGLLTADEKRTKLDAEIAALAQELGV